MIANIDKLSPQRGDTSISEDLVFDFLAEAPSARWTNGFGTNPLTWLGRRDDPHGFAIWINNEQLEDGSQPAAALLTHPEWKDNFQGQIRGDFILRMPVQPKDHFRARPGFLRGARGEVEFLVEAFGRGLSGRVASVTDNGIDGILRAIDVDLTL